MLNYYSVGGLNSLSFAKNYYFQNSLVGTATIRESVTAKEDASQQTP